MQSTYDNATNTRRKSAHNPAMVINEETLSSEDQFTGVSDEPTAETDTSQVLTMLKGWNHHMPSN